MVPATSWTDYGARSATRAENPHWFIEEQVSPLFFHSTREGRAQRRHHTFFAEKDFWREASFDLIATVALQDFTITDWFPRSPGTYWSERAASIRRSIYNRGDGGYTPELGKFFNPSSKVGLIENGGIGSIRLRPRRIDGDYCWLATAVTGDSCHGGVPLAIPETLLQRTGFRWDESATVTGRIRFLQDADLNDVAENVHGVQPLILFVEELVPGIPIPDREALIISPVVLFDDKEDRYNTQFTFAQCLPNDSDVNLTVEWMEAYADKFSGRIITNFDEQRPILASAPLSYQRLVTKTFDRQVINLYGGRLIAERVETLTYDYSNHYHGDVYMGDHITASGNATIINRSTITNSALTINAAPSLSPEQKSQLTTLVKAVGSELEPIQATHPAEAKKMDRAIEDAVAEVTKPVAERKKSFLDLTATGLLQTAKLLIDVAPGVVHTAGQLAAYIQGLA